MANAQTQMLPTPNPPTGAPESLAESLADDPAFTSQYVALADADRVDGEGPVWDEDAGEWVSAAGGGGSSDAADIDIADTGELYDATDVEAALAEVAADVAAIGGGYSSVWIKAQNPDMTNSFGAVSFTTLGAGSQTTPYWPVARFDPTTAEGVRGVLIPPAGWSTFDVDLYWAGIATPSSGNVVWQWQQVSIGDGDSTASSYTAQPNVTDAAPDLRVLNVTTLVAGATALPDEPMLFQLTRVATDAADTCTDDVGVLGVRLIRVT